MYGNIFILGIIFTLLLVVSIFVVMGLIKRLLKWQQEINRKLKIAAKEAILAGKAKSQFLAQMSHEIRTPMNAVLGMNELILRESKNPVIIDYAENIQRAGKTLLTLINSILDFSKIENGQMKIVPVRYETVMLLNDLLNIAAERASKKGLKLILDIDSELPRVLFGDDVRIKQVVTNLLTNAIKYTHEGSVTLTFKVVSADIDSVEILVKVIDTGIGIRAEDINKLSISFTRLDEEKNRNIEGTGLGISIVQKLLAMMNSKLNIESVYGKGSTFSFRLVQKVIDKNPVGDFKNLQLNRVKENKKSKTYFNAAGAKILVVDDNSMNLKVIFGIMKFNSVAPDLADGGAQCLELAAKNKYDIIFLDHMMPNMDGIETLRKLKAQHLADETIIIALTANAISGAKEMYLKAGFDDYLSKPVNPDALDATLKKYLPADLATRKNFSAVKEKAADTFTTAEKNLSKKYSPAEETVETAADTLTTAEKILSKKYSPAEETAETAADTFTTAEKILSKKDSPAEETAETAADTFTAAEKILLKKLCPEINLDTAMGYCMDSKEFFVEMMQEFYGGNKTELLNKLYAAEDWNNYKIQVHALKSTSLVIGAENFSERARAQEFAAKESRIEDLKNNHAEFIISYTEILEQIENWLKGTNNAKNIDS